MDEAQTTLYSRHCILHLEKEQRETCVMILLLHVNAKSYQNHESYQQLKVER